MNIIKSCGFNMDTDCVELVYADDTMISIHCTRLENAIAENRYERAELDWLIYNEPLTYAQLVINGGIEEYVKGIKGHKLED